jgi:HD-GYP domain-containing protein (c-di-GMP phosphodiesterase class II)
MTSVNRVATFVALIVVAALAAVWNGFKVELVAIPLSALIAFIGLAFALEYWSVGLPHRAQGSVVFIVLIAIGILFGPTWAAAVSGSSLLVAQLLARKSALRVIFNVAQRVLSISLGVQVYVSLGGQTPIQSLEADWFAFLALALVFFGVNSVAVATVIALDQGKAVREVWTSITRGPFVYDVAASFAAVLLAWAYLRFGLTGLFGAIAPVVVIRSVYSLYHRLEAQSREMLELMVKAIEARDPYTSGHSVRVAAMSRAIANEMKLPYDRVDQIATAALLHDVGKIHEKFAPLLRKEARLTPEEHLVLQDHPIKSAELVGVISGFVGAIQISVRSHHERWDGNGYPDGLKGEEVPLGARIIAVADTVDAMRTDRPYRPAATYEETVRELERCRGTQFDPGVIDVALGSMLVRSMFAAPQEVRGLPEPTQVPEEAPKRRSSGWMRVLR